MGLFGAYLSHLIRQIALLNGAVTSSFLNYNAKSAPNIMHFLHNCRKLLQIRFHKNVWTKMFGLKCTNVKLGAPAVFSGKEKMG